MSADKVDVLEIIKRELKRKAEKETEDYKLVSAVKIVNSPKMRIFVDRCMN